MASQDEDDPFGMFGDDSDGDQEENEASKIARSLVDSANQRQTAGSSASPPSSAISKRKEDGGDAGLESDTSVIVGNEVHLPWRKPLYLGPVKLVSLEDYGGSRGYVACRNLAPGTLVMVEQAILSWPSGHFVNGLDLSLVQYVIQSSNAQEVLYEMEHFHPTKLRVDDEATDDGDDVQIGSMMNSLSSKYHDDTRLHDMISYIDQIGLTNSDGTKLSEQDCLRILLALRYNGLESGVYLHVAMLNHADQPNCVKFFPDDKPYSEVRTTRAVRAGEPLTISYVPTIVSHASRRKHLWDQHRFDIGVRLSSALNKMELVGGALPVSDVNRWDETSVTNRVEHAIDELRQCFEETQDAYKGGTIPNDLWQQARELEQATYELCQQATEQLQNDRHILLIPCLELHLDAADRVQRDSSLGKSHRMSLLGRSVSSAKRLVSLQEILHGPDHFALARTYLDLAQAIEELLSRSPTNLLELGQEGFDTVSSWAALEHESRREYSRIKTLYPRDAESFVGTV